MRPRAASVSPHGCYQENKRTNVLFGTAGVYVPETLFPVRRTNPVTGTEYGTRIDSLGGEIPAGWGLKKIVVSIPGNSQG